MSQLPFQQNPYGQAYYQFPPNQQYAYATQPYVQYPQNQPPPIIKTLPKPNISSMPDIYSKTSPPPPPQSPGVITSQRETQTQYVIHRPGSENFENKTVLLQKSQYSRQTLEVVGQFHPPKMNPISRTYY